jgi:hypothetical protein
MTAALAFLFLIFVGLPGAFMAGCAFQRMVDRERRGGYVLGGNVTSTADLPAHPALTRALIEAQIGRDPERLARELAAKQGPWRGGRLR